MARMRFGTFIAPHHPVGEHPTLQFERDLQMIEHFDQLRKDTPFLSLMTLVAAGAGVFAAMTIVYPESRKPRPAV